MIRTLLLLAGIFPLSVFAQQYINQAKTAVRTLLQKEIQTTGTIKVITETDSTLVLSPKITEKGKEVTWTYGFNNEGRCHFEKFTTLCRECYERSLQSVIAIKTHQWKKITENQYVSKFADKLLLEISPEDNEYHFTIFRANWTKEMYDMLQEK